MKPKSSRKLKTATLLHNHSVVQVRKLAIRTAKACRKHRSRALTMSGLIFIEARRKGFVIHRLGLP